MLQETAATLAAAGIAERPGTLAGDSGYCSIAGPGGRVAVAAGVA